MNRLNILALVSFCILCTNAFSQNATITIKNKSERNVFVKLMQGPEKKAVLYKTDSVAAKGEVVINIQETGFYFTKLRAIQYDKKDPNKNDTIYSKDRPFQVIADKKRRQYSNITIEFKVKEVKNSGSVSITRKEFDH